MTVSEGTSPSVLSGRATLFDWLRWALAALWLFVMVTAVLAGSREADFDTLVSDLNSGRVSSVAVTPGLPDGADGSAQQTIFWTGGLLHRHTVVQVSTDNAPDASALQGNVTRIHGHDAAVELRRDYPGLTVTRASYITSWAEFYGFRVPQWLIWPMLGGAVLTLMVLVSGGEPWRASRWAWFWLLSTAIGPPLFLFLSGRTWPIPDPRAGHRRLSGGWAFIIAAVCGSFLFA